jgi:hypothetical protein
LFKNNGRPKEWRKNENFHTIIQNKNNEDENKKHEEKKKIKEKKIKYFKISDSNNKNNDEEANIEKANNNNNSFLSSLPSSYKNSYCIKLILNYLKIKI